MRALINRITAFAVGIGALAVAVLMGHVILDSSLRTLFSSPIRGTIEIVAFWWLVAIAFLPLGGGQRNNEHLTAPVLHERLSLGFQRLWTRSATVLALVVVSALAWYGWDQALDMLRIGERTGAVRTIVWPSRFLVPLGAALWALQLLRALASPPDGELGDIDGESAESTDGEAGR